MQPDDPVQCAGRHRLDLEGLHALGFAEDAEMAAEAVVQVPRSTGRADRREDNILSANARS